MAHSKKLESQHMERVRAHIGAFLHTHRNPAFAPAATFIEESFEILVLPIERISSAVLTPGRLSELLLKTGNWHHQISQDGRTVGFALSGATGTVRNGWLLRAVFAAELATIL